MDVSIKIRENGDISWLKNMYEKFKNKNSFNKDNIGLLNEKENNNSYCQEHCKGYQETRRCFADGECQAKKNAESAWSKGDEYVLEAITRKTQESPPL